MATAWPPKVAAPPNRPTSVAALKERNHDHPEDPLGDTPRVMNTGLRNVDSIDIDPSL